MSALKSLKKFLYEDLASNKYFYLSNYHLERFYSFLITNENIKDPFTILLIRNRMPTKDQIESMIFDFITIDQPRGRSME